MSSLCIIDKSIKWILMFFPHFNQLDQNRTMYLFFFMLHILLLTILSEMLCMFLYNLTVVTSQKLTVNAKTLWFFPRILWILFHLNSQGFDWQHTCCSCFSQTVAIPMCINYAPISPICSFVRTKKTSRKKTIEASPIL